MRLNIFLALLFAAIGVSAATLPVAMSTTNGQAVGTTTIGGRILATNTAANGGTNHFVGTINSATNISSQGIFHGNGSGLTNIASGTGMKTNQFTTNTVGSDIVGNVGFAANVGINGANKNYDLNIESSVTGAEAFPNFGTYGNFVVTPSANLLGYFAPFAAYASISPSAFRVNELVCVFTALNVNNTNTGNNGSSVVGHFSTSPNGAASHLSAFRTSMDLGSNCNVGTVSGLWIPQVDVGSNGIIGTVSGVSIDDLNVDRLTKPSVWGIEVKGATMRNAFDGPTSFGLNERGMTNAQVAIGPSSTSTNTTGGTGKTNVILRVAPVYAQTGSAAATDILVDRSGSVGAGNQNLIDLQVSGVSKFNVSSLGAISNNTASFTHLTGPLYSAGAATIDGLVTVGTSGIIGSSAGTLLVKGGAGRDVLIQPGTGADVNVTTTSGGRIFLNAETRTSTDLFAAGNVGVGTTAPTNKLQVIGAIQSTTTVFANAGGFTNDVVSSQGIFYGNGVGLTNLPYILYTNGSGTNTTFYGPLSVADYLYATNTARTNTISGRVVGSGGVTTGAGGVALGLNNQAGSYSLLTGIGNLSVPASILMGGQSNVSFSGSQNSLVSGGSNSVSGPSEFVSGSRNSVEGNNSAAIGSDISFVANAHNSVGIGTGIAFTASPSNTIALSAGTGGISVTRSNAIYLNSVSGVFISGGPITGDGSGLTGVPVAGVTGIRHGISGAMVLGTVTVTDTGCTANTRYFFSAHTLGTISIPGGYYASTRNVGTSFVISSSQATETSTIDWMAIEPP